MKDEEKLTVFKTKTDETIGDLRQQVRYLEDKLSKYENPKNSGNSSVAPSQDSYRRTKKFAKEIKQKPGRTKMTQRV